MNKKGFNPKFIRFSKFKNSNVSVCKYTPCHAQQNVLWNKEGMDLYDIIIFKHVKLFWVDTQAKGELHPKIRDRGARTITSSHKLNNNYRILLGQFGYMHHKKNCFTYFKI